MLALALFVGLGAFVDAACAEELQVGPDGGCSLELCCSCCVHVRIDSHVVLALPSPPCAKATLSRSLERKLLPEPREVMHVPKASHS